MSIIKTVLDFFGDLVVIILFGIIVAILGLIVDVVITIFYGSVSTTAVIIFSGVLGALLGLMYNIEFRWPYNCYGFLLCTVIGLAIGLNWEYIAQVIFSITKIYFVNTCVIPGLLIVGVVSIAIALTPWKTPLEFREVVAKRISKLEEEGDINGLIREMKSSGKDEFKMEEVASSLMRLGDTRSVKPLIELLNHGNKVVRRYAARVLGEIGDQQAVEPPIKAPDRDDEVKVDNELDASTENLLSKGMNLMENENYVEALLVYSQVLHSEPKSETAIGMFAVADKKLLETVMEEYKKVDSSRQHALSRLNSGNGTEADAHNLAASLIAVKRWDVTVKKHKEIRGDQYGTAEGLSEENIKAGVFLAGSYLSIVKGKERSTGSGLGFSSESRAILEEGLVKMKRAVECLCLAMIPDQWRKQFEILARDFAGEQLGDMARQLANNRDMIDPVEGLPELAERMAFNYAFMCQTNLALIGSV